mgnify:CR=1 FL=1
MMNNYGTISDLVMAPDFEQLREIESIGPKKVQSISQCFRGNFWEECIEWFKNEIIIFVQ